MTTNVKITNTGHYPVVVNVWEAKTPRDEGINIERIDLAPTEETHPITIYGWQRGITVLEAAPKEDALPNPKDE